MLEILNQYCSQVLSGEIPSGLHLRNAVSRFHANMLTLDENGWEFREDSVNKVIKFVSKLKHFTGKHANKPFKLLPWQVFIIANLYGFYNKDGSRRFNTAYLEMARKQGKTALVAALAMYHLIADDEQSAEILFAANSKDQAKIGFNMVKAFSKGYDPDGKRIKSRWLDIYFDESNSFIKVLAADSSKIDGYNCSLGIVDEYHSAPDSSVRDVIRSSQGMRVNPLLITITTAGFDKSLPCYDLRTVCTEIIAGVKKDESLFSVIYSLDEEDDWRDPKVWLKSNPNLGVTVNEEFLSTQVQQAINSPNDEVGVKTKNLNVWCDSAEVWIPDSYIVAASKKIDFNDFKGENCYVGVDLASNVDLTAVSYLFYKDDKYYFKTEYYIPHDTLGVHNLHADKELYKDWAGNKYLKVTAGNVTDYDYITKDLLDVSNNSDILKVYYDKYNANAWVIQCTEMGINLEPFSQALGNFNNCTKEFERLILSGKVVLDDNPINRYCLRNVMLKKDFNDNAKPIKMSEKKKIDGVISMLQALASYQSINANYKGINIF